MFRHLQETNQRYPEHFKFGFTSGLRCIQAGICSIIHAFLPDVMPFKAETIVKELAELSRQRTEARNKQ